MMARLRSWWQKTSKPLDAVIVTVLVVLLALVVLIILGYSFNWSWAGLHGRTLYDWLQLLIIPAVLAVGGYLFNYTTGRTEREIASDRQREEAIQAYIDDMSALLLEKNLRKSSEDDEVRKIARVRTLTVLQRLDGERKGIVIQFLHESGLINKNNPVIDLGGADLRQVYLFGAILVGACLRGTRLHKAILSLVGLHGADLSGAFLFEANLGDALLSGADLTTAHLDRANLDRTDLHGADLRGASLGGASLDIADLRGANLTGAKVTTEQLDKAYSLKDATMPDGSKHA